MALETLRDSLFGRTPERLAQASIAALNARDYAALRAMLSDRFRYRDRDGNVLASPEAFIASIHALVATAPDFRLEVDSIERFGASVVMRGHTRSRKSRLRSASLWRLRARRGRIESLESYHANEGMRLFEHAPQSAES